MRTLFNGWLCAECGHVTLEFLRTRPARCAHCAGTTWKFPVYVHKQTAAPQPRKLTDVARTVRAVIARADADNLALGDGNVIDLLADNIAHVPLADLRDALVTAGLAHRFPEATRRHD